MVRQLSHVQGWICNSSICMTRRGMKPTGIAIFEAQQKGFPSVARFVQVQRCLLILPNVHLLVACQQCDSR